jgi:hypothetical protein
MNFTFYASSYILHTCAALTIEMSWKESPDTSAADQSNTALIFTKFAEVEESLNTTGTSPIDTNDFKHVNMSLIFQNPVPIYFSFTFI